MPGNKPFDQAASRYDRDFTFTLTGKAQRKVVHRYLARRIATGTEILEINCGTGEDAIFLAGLGCTVTATDASEAMIAEAQRKTADGPMAGSVKFSRLGFSELPSLRSRPKFDLVFSNFSGLNCLNPEEITILSKTLKELLRPEGRLILVLFGKKCLSERLYFLLKGRSSLIRRRNTHLPVTVGGTEPGTQVWYYSVKELQELFPENFILKYSRPVGLFLPPSYLDPFFRTKQWLLHLLAFMESLFGRASFLSDRGDHFLAEFRKR
jgi:ubiquinone/menaquinone biosynthesis C-methylase UbiE